MKASFEHRFGRVLRIDIADGTLGRFVRGDDLGLAFIPAGTAAHEVVAIALVRLPAELVFVQDVHAVGRAVITIVVADLGPQHSARCLDPRLRGQGASNRLEAQEIEHHATGDCEDREESRRSESAQSSIAFGGSPDRSDGYCLFRRSLAPSEVDSSGPDQHEDQGEEGHQTDQRAVSFEHHVSRVIRIDVTRCGQPSGILSDEFLGSGVLTAAFIGASVTGSLIRTAFVLVSVLNRKHIGFAPFLAFLHLAGDDGARRLLPR